MTEQGPTDETATTNVPTPPDPAPVAPAYQQPVAAQPGWGVPPPPAGPAWGQPQQPPAGYPPQGYQQQPPAGGPAWGQPQQPPAGYPPQGYQQQPPAGGPAWGQPQQPPAQYWGQPGMVADNGKGSSVLAIIAGIPLLLYGLLTTLAGAALIVVGSFVNDVINQSGADVSLAGTIRNAVTVIAVIILIYGILEILAAIGIWAHKGWGRALGIIFGVLGTLIGLAAVAGGRSTVTINGTVSNGGGIGFALFILVPYAFVLLAMIVGGAHFRRRRS